MKKLSFVLLTLLLAAVLSAELRAETFTVTHTADGEPGSLREAIMDANVTPNVDDVPDEIVFSGEGVIGTITLTSDLPDIKEAVTLTGPGADQLTIDGNVNGIFTVDTSSSDPVTISGLTLTRAGKISGGNANDSGAALDARPGSSVILDQMVFENSRSYVGGAIRHLGVQLTITNSTIGPNNRADREGGGIHVQSTTGTLSLRNVTISGNSAKEYGGGINVEAIGTMNLSNVTITDNTADEGDGGGMAQVSAGVVNMKNSIIAGNTDGGNGSDPDCFGTIISQGYNLIGVDSAGCDIGGSPAGYIAGQDPLLADLAGSPTQTHALQAGSPAIDKGHPEGCTDETGAILTADQRGVARVGACDIGAYEFVGSCGDGFAHTGAGEECDDSGESANCDSDCTLASCGDDTLNVTAGEGCDDGNKVDTDDCLSSCVSATCGDGHVKVSVEQCDNGENNSDTIADACRKKCVKAFCGDGVMDAGEECDNGANNSNTAADACRMTCVKAACGDGTKDTGEACDDGNIDDGDNCSSTCTTEDGNGDGAGDGAGAVSPDTGTGGCSLIR